MVIYLHMSPVLAESNDYYINEYIENIRQTNFSIHRMALYVNAMLTLIQKSIRMATTFKKKQ